MQLIRFIVLRLRAILTVIIQHIDTLPNMVKKKLSMYVGPHDVYATIYLTYICKFFLKEKKKIKRLHDDISSSNCVLLAMC